MGSATGGPSMTAIGRVWGLDSRAIFIAMVSGTARNIPTLPSTSPQNSSARNTARVEMPSPRPMIRGSR